MWQNDLAGPEDDPAVAAVARLVDDAARVTVLTGAGISTDSGIPDFRGPQGIWTKNPEAERQSTLANYVADAEVRRAVWRSRLDHRALSAEPNAGHRALVRLEQRSKLVALITQNVDGLHQLAGVRADKVVEVHGTIREVACLTCDYRDDIAVAFDRVRRGDDDPACPECGGILKSATISFGQSLVQRDLLRAQLAAENCDVMLAVGTTLAVWPVAAVVPAAVEAGAEVVIVNAEPTEMDHLARYVLRHPISRTLPLLVG
ncbi:MAG TPA: NAD-dependent deacetylase [Acidimicrobiaceae bacterium]|nr:NAD-dependent deacetylase [Acidimicrobiaceae bacterium]HCB36796.1 NAD-dependent deacetylase [Acidimicrobiaceae bacterium]